MDKLVELHVRYRGSERFLRLALTDGRWSAALMVPGREDMFGECPPRAPRGAVLPAADLDGMTLRIEYPPGHVVSLAVAKLVAAGAAVRDGWIAVPLRGITRDLQDALGDPMPEPPRAEILAFPPRAAKARDFEMER